MTRPHNPFPGKGRKLGTGKKRAKPNPIGEIRTQQKSTGNLLNKTAMGRVVSDCIDTQSKLRVSDAPRVTRMTADALKIINKVSRKTSGAMLDVREVAQDDLVTGFHNANEIAIHTKRTTVKANDMKLERSILEKRGFV